MAVYLRQWCLIKEEDEDGNVYGLTPPESFARDTPGRFILIQN
jgi:hypothetical protein